MYTLFLTVVINAGVSYTHPVDGKTFTSLKSCESYKKSMQYETNSGLVFKCDLTLGRKR